MHTKLKVLVSVIATSAMVGGIAAAASSPSVTTGSASSIKTTSAVLHGAVNPNGSGTSYTFQWGLTSAYGVNGASHSAGSGTTAKSASATAGGLLPGTPYHYRLIATNRFGVTVGADRTFKTRGNPPP